jgi:hypothetical protein
VSGTVKLRAGTIDAAGNLEAGSMAKAIDDALAVLVPVKPGEDPRGRRKLALAVAQGVVNHLVANEDAFVVNVADGGAAIDRTVRIDRW